MLGLVGHKDSPATISVEMGSRVFAPIMDIQGNIRRLIDPKTKTVAERYDFTAFGEGLQTQGDPCAVSPWRFASKRMHPELGLINFGKRFYDPLIGRWLTTDPAGFANSINLYQYVLNNPFRYADPDGQFAFLVPLMIPLIEIALPTLAVTVPTMTQLGVAAGIALIGTVGYKIVHEANKQDAAFSSASDQALRLDTSCEEEKKKKHNTNPFDGPVSEDVIVIDEAGNAINVPQGNWLTGTKDGKWIQEMQPGVGPKGEPTGQRKDGGGHPPPKHKDVRANAPHAHVPGVTNPDGTEWLRLKE